MEAKKLQKNDGTETTVTVATQAVRATGGNLVEVPANRYGLHDTRDIAQTVDFFPPSPSGSRAESNYDQMPPNPSEPTIITRLGIAPTSAIVKNDAANSIDAFGLANGLQGGLVQVLRTDTQAVLAEEPAERFFSEVAADGDNVSFRSPAKLPALEEAIVVPQGIGYRVRLILADGTPIPSDANYAASGQRKIRLRCRAEHRGNTGR